MNTTAGCNTRLGYSCCYNQYLNNSNGCIECPAGSFGWNCEQKCVTGYYGRLCNSYCECPAHDCHHVTGCDLFRENSTSLSSITPNATHQTSTFYEWTSETPGLQTSMTSNLFPTGHRDQYRYLNQHDDTWIAVSCSLIGSLVTLCVVGCLLYFRSRQQLRVAFPKRFRRISFSGIKPDRNVESLQEGHHELSTLNPIQQCQDEDTYTEIRYSQIGGACAETCMNTISTNKKGNTIYKEPGGVSRNTNLYEKFSFENEYDHINLKVKSSLPELIQKGQGVVCSKDQEYVSLSDKSPLQEEFPNHDGSCKSLTLPFYWKRVGENNKLKSRSHSLCHAVSEGELMDEQESKESGENVVKLIPDSLVTTTDPKLKEEARPYSFVHSLSYNDLNSKEENRSSTELFSAVTQEEKEDFEKEDPGRFNNRPYSYVKKWVE